MMEVYCDWSVRYSFHSSCSTCFVRRMARQSHTSSHTISPTNTTNTTAYSDTSTSPNGRLVTTR